MATMINKCPSCGFTLEFGDSKQVTCPACGNLVVKEDEPASNSNSNSPVFGGRSAGTISAVDGIQTAGSAYAYFEQLMADYDFDSFCQTSQITISEVDQIVSKIQVVSADNPVTWVLSFDAIALPVLKRFSVYKDGVSSIVEQYQKNVKQAYTLFENRSSALRTTLSYKDIVVKKLNKYLDLAVKYEATNEDVSRMKANLEEVTKNFEEFVVYDSLDDVPAIIELEKKNSERIQQEMLEKGINAEETYQEALTCIENNELSKAYSLLSTIRGYKEADELIGRSISAYNIGKIYELCGKKFVLRNGKIYKVENATIVGKALVKDIKKFICAYFEFFVYIASDDTFRVYNVNTSETTTVPVPDKKKITNVVKFFPISVHALGLVFQITSGGADVVSTTGLLVFNYYKKEITIISSKIESFMFCNDQVVVYRTLEERVKADTKLTEKVLRIHAYNCLTEAEVYEGEKEDVIAYVCQKGLVLTRSMPDINNIDIYFQEFGGEKHLIEKNAFRFTQVVDGQIFYSVGNKHYSTLFRNSFTGDDRVSLPANLKNVLYKEGDYYFSLRGYSSLTLTKASLDGSKEVTIASHVKSFECEQRGYFYYINTNNSLCKARYDGKYTSLICEDVTDSLAILPNETVVYTTLDDKHSIESLYTYDNVSKQRKIVYNLYNAQMYDDEHVDYVVVGKKQTKENGAIQFDEYHRVNIYTLEDEVVFEDYLQNKKSKVPGVVMLILGIVILIVGIALLASGEVGGVAPLIIGLILSIIGIALLARKSTVVDFTDSVIRVRNRSLSSTQAKAKDDAAAAVQSQSVASKPASKSSTKTVGLIFIIIAILSIVLMIGLYGVLYETSLSMLSLTIPCLIVGIILLAVKPKK